MASKLGTDIHEAALKVRDIAYRTDSGYIVILIESGNTGVGSHMATDLSLPLVKAILEEILLREPKDSVHVKVGES